jgi:hypothetical protein
MYKMSFGWSIIRDSGYLSYNTTPVTSNLQVYLRPSSYSGSGTTWDNLQNTTEPTLVGAPSYNPIRGFTLNGTNQCVTLPSVSNITNFTSSQDYTIEVWCNISSTQNDTGNPDNCIVEKWNTTNEGAYPYIIRLIRPSNISIAVYNGTANPLVSFSAGTLNTWVQIVGVFDHTNNLLYAYRNGQLVTSGAMNITGTSNNSTVNLGRRGNISGGGNNYFTGSIGLFRIYSSALNATQVLQNFNADKATFGL